MLSGFYQFGNKNEIRIPRVYIDILNDHLSITDSIPTNVALELAMEISNYIHGDNSIKQRSFIDKGYYYSDRLKAVLRCEYEDSYNSYSEKIIAQLQYPSGNEEHIKLFDLTVNDKMNLSDFLLIMNCIASNSNNKYKSEGNTIKRMSVGVQCIFENIFYCLNPDKEEKENE